MHPKVNKEETPPAMIKISDFSSKMIENTIVVIAEINDMHPKTAIAIDESIIDVF